MDNLVLFSCSVYVCNAYVIIGVPNPLSSLELSLWFTGSLELSLWFTGGATQEPQSPALQTVCAYQYVIKATNEGAGLSAHLRSTYELKTCICLQSLICIQFK